MAKYEAIDTQYSDHDPSEFESAWPPRRRSRLGRLIVSLVVLGAILLLGLPVLYAGRIYPGITVAGVKLGGLNSSQAKLAITSGLEEYQRTLIPVNYGDTTLSISPAKLELKYDAAALTAEAMSYGRRGSLGQTINELMHVVTAQSIKFVGYSYNDTRLAPYLDDIDNEVNRPVSNASFNITGESVTINPAQTGTRLNRGGLVLLLGQRLGDGSSAAIDAPNYHLSPVIEGSSLGAVQDQVSTIVSAPLKLTAGSKSIIVDQPEIISWVKLDRPAARSFAESGDIRNFYPAYKPVTLSLDQGKIEQLVAKFATAVNQPGQNAALAIQDGKATVFQPSRDGIALDQPKAVNDIKLALTKSASDRQLALSVKVAKPEVTEDSLNDLGIKELISEGFSTFPGSSADRLTNVRVGAALYNGVLLKPNEVFSFGQILGDVGPEQGYKPSLVILGNKEEKQYGGGLCQVSSTAYRAALNAGLPILERTNHAFAINEFYTQPYGVPGVDATIYYPQVDFKFKNDTGHYILIQTKMEGTTLKFDFYGTKTKEGRIRGPQFISGSLDATQPSHTVFYRDVVDLTGKVIKTDTTETYYKSSKDFTIVNSTQFH